MSGIAGTLSFDAPAREATIDAMLARLAHRGTEPPRRVVDGAVALGEVTLVTIPEDVGAVRPYQDDRFLAVGDVRLDRRDPGDAPDLSQIVAGYARWGRDVVHHLDGDFAFAIWDRARRTLFCARDRAGVKPFYFARVDDGLRFASEMQPLFVEGFSRSVDRLSVALFLVDRYDERRRTLYEGVEALPPGHALFAEHGKVAIDAYWIPSIPRSPPPDDPPTAFRLALKEAVRSRMRANGPIACEVSGGLDSTSVAALACEIAREEGRPLPLLVTRSYPGTDADETEYSRALAKFLGAELKVFEVRAEDSFLDPRRAGEVADAYYHPTLADQRSQFEWLAANERRVVLTGQGADDWMARDVVLECADHLRRGAFRDALEIPRRGLVARMRVLRAAVLQAILPDSFIALIRALRGVDPPDWVTPRLRRRLREHAQSEKVGSSAEAFLERALLDRRRRGISNLVLARMDRLAASYGVDVRHPFYDSAVARTLAAVPHALRAGVGMNMKPLSRIAMEGRLPRSILDRREKSDFVDYVARTLGSWRDAFRPRDLIAEGIVKPSAARLLDSPHRRSAAALAAMETWIRDVLS